MSDYGYVIDKNVPIPLTSHLFRAMEIGDSIKFPIEKRAKVEQNVFRIGKKYNMKFTTRKVDNNSIRTWRIE